MIAAQLIVVLTGLLYVGASMALGVVVRLLGPTYHTKVTAPWPVIAFFALAAALLLWRGVTILFPGHLVDTTGMSLVATATAAVVVGLTLFILDFVMGDRSPPPLFSRYFGWAVRHGLDDAIIASTFDKAPAMHLAAPPAAQITRCGRKTRLFVLTSAAAVILTILGVVAATAGGI